MLMSVYTGGPANARCFRITQVASAVAMPHLLKSAVMGPKKSIKSASTVLDLSYITPRVLVSAGPVDTPARSVFRDNIANVVAFLDLEHGRGHWHVWNLRSEGPGYAFNSVVGPHCSYKPFPDHQVPSFGLMEEIAEEIHAFLEKDEHNVALIHCKQGKGRSGTVCCGYLMYEAQKLGDPVTVEEMVAKFTAHRMKRWFGPGVSISSQLRFLRYWGIYLGLSPELLADFAFFSSPLGAFRPELSSILFLNPNMLLWRLQISVFKHDGLGLRRIYSQIVQNSPEVSFNRSGSFCSLDLGVPLVGVSLVKILIEVPGVRCYCWCSPYFETLERRKKPLKGGVFADSLGLEWGEWDGFWGTSWKGPVKLFERAVINWVFDEED